MPGKRVLVDDETWQQLDLLGRDQMKEFQELADEAFRDLLKKHGRPASLKEALRRSAGASASVIQLKPPKKQRRR
ncbi:MAG: hypothetical protein WBB34_07340 [Xanthobacteraceae bacterium]